MKKASDYLTKLHGRYDGVSALTSALSEALRNDGVPHATAKFDNKVCLTCGCGLDNGCPGVHTFEEIQEANRAEVISAGTCEQQHEIEERATA